MTIAGIDPGSGRIGWGVIEVNPLENPQLTCVAYGCIETPKEKSTADRLIILQKCLRAILRQYKPSAVSIEQLFFGANAKTAMLVGQARGVIMLTIAAYHMNLFEYQGLSIKLTVTGSGRAGKQDMQKKVQKILRLKERPRPDDAADGLASAIMHAVKTGLVSLESHGK